MTRPLGFVCEAGFRLGGILNQFFEAGAGVDTARDLATSGGNPLHGVEALRCLLNEMPIVDVAKVDASGQRRRLDNGIRERRRNREISYRTYADDIDDRSTDFEDARGGSRSLDRHECRALQSPLLV